MTGKATGRTTSRVAGLVTCVLAAALLACGRAPRRPSEAVPGHAWRTVTARGGPTYTFRAGQQVEMLAAGGMMMGTYQFPTDSTLALNVTGRIPGVSSGPTTLDLRFDVRTLPPGPDGHKRIEFRAGTATDTLARVD